MKKENKVKPISPKEVTHMIPDFIFEAVNKLINEKWNGESATILQDEIMEIVSSDDEDDERPRAPPIIEQPNLNPNPITFRRRRLAF